MSSPGEWFPAVPVGAIRVAEGRQTTFTTTFSTIEDLSYTPSKEQESRDLAQMKATGRRTWKTLRGKAEAVWSPELEAVLIEALEEYRLSDEYKPQTSKRGTRFPYRNRFVSEYIYRKVGRTRTHKQVGSRLQQLRDTCEDSRILTLVSGGPCKDPEDECKQEPERTLPSKVPMASDSPTQDYSGSQAKCQVVYAQITTQLTPPPNRTPRIQFINNHLGNPITLQLCSSSSSQFIAGHSPASLSLLSNTIQFFSHWRLNQETRFTVYDGDLVVQQEKGSLRLVTLPSNTGGRGWVYECHIAGASWRTICGSKDPNRITILQSLIPSTIKPAQSTTTVGREVSIVYRFKAEPQLTATTNLRHPTTVPGMLGYGQTAGSSRSAWRHSSCPDPSNMGSPSRWPSTSARYQGLLDATQASEAGLTNSPSNPLSVGYQRPSLHNMFSPRSVGGSLSGSNSLEQFYHDLGPFASSSHCSESEPRVAQQWGAMSGGAFPFVPTGWGLLPMPVMG